MSSMENHNGKHQQDNSGSLADRLVKGLSEGVLCIALSMGLNTGLVQVLLQHDEPVSVDQLAEESHCKPRYVEEWLGVVTAAGIVQVDATDQLYRLKSQYKQEIGPNPERYLPFILTQFFQSSIAPTQLIQDAFKQHGPLGTSYADYPDVSNLIDKYSQATHSEESIRRLVDQVPALKYRLEAGISVCELGAGKGHQAKLMARMWPKSSFLASDISEEAIHLGQKAAQKESIPNLRWKVLDASSLPPSMDDSFDLVYICDSLHDVPNASQALSCCHRVLKSDGMLVLLEENMESGHSRNSGPRNTLSYGLSLMHCLPVSLGVAGSEGLGACWGKDKIRLYCTQSGFKIIQCKVFDKQFLLVICAK